MIVWQADWRAFDAPEGEEHFLRELRAETGDDNPRHPLHGKACRILGWRERGHKHFILHVSPDDRYAFVHLTWSRETDPAWPHCERFDDEGAVNAFLWEWGQDHAFRRITAALRIVSSEAIQREHMARHPSYDLAADWVRRWPDEFYRPGEPNFRSSFSADELNALATFDATLAEKRPHLPAGPSAGWWDAAAWREIVAAAQVALASFPQPAPDEATEDPPR